MGGDAGKRDDISREGPVQDIFFIWQRRRWKEKKIADFPLPKNREKRRRNAPVAKKSSVSGEPMGRTKGREDRERVLVGTKKGGLYCARRRLQNHERRKKKKKPNAELESEGRSAEGKGGSNIRSSLGLQHQHPCMFKYKRRVKWTAPRQKTDQLKNRPPQIEDTKNAWSREGRPGKT